MNTQIKETYFMNHINPNRVRIFSSSIVKIGEVQLSGVIGDVLVGRALFQRWGEGV